MRLVWTEESLDALSDIVNYIASDNESAAYTLGDTIITNTEALLLPNPKLGRPGRVASTRELVIHASYIVVYMISEDIVTVLTIRHTARFWLSNI